MQLHTLLSTNSRNQELNTVKKVHKFGHANAGDLQALTKPSGYDQEKLKEA